MNIQVNQERITADLDALASFSDTQAPAVTRIVFSRVDLEARRWLKQRCASAALEVREDAVGNMFARWPGTNPDLGPVASGSHIDAIPHSGKYDEHGRRARHAGGHARAAPGRISAPPLD